MSSDKKITVVVVDDNDVSRRMLCHIVASDERYIVVGEAQGGIVGRQLTELLQPDVVCLDINMPDVNGIALLKLIKEQWPQIVVLMVTGSSDRQSVVQAVRGGADGYLVKPFNPVNLLSTLSQAVAKARG
jgi:two-component system chemotaxis response regulator CheY